MKSRLFIILICYMCCTCGIASGEGVVAEKSGLNLPYDNVTKVEISSDGPSYSEYEKYSYTTSAKNEIAYIIMYMNSFNLYDDGQIFNADDVSSYSINIHMLDGSINKCGFYCKRFYDASDRQYAMDSKEYTRLLDFVNALKTGRIVLTDEVTFEPSEWAKEDVEKAIENGLLPLFCQIDYKGRINRLEVCRLIDNLLKKQNGVEPPSAENPFSDITDDSVINLFGLGIINGKSKNKFSPYDLITREEFAKILTKTYYLMNGAEPHGKAYEYSDQKEISDWALNDVSNMHLLKVMVGNENNEFKPKYNITKEEVIAAVLRLSEIVPRTDGDGQMGTDTNRRISRDS